MLDGGICCDINTVRSTLINEKSYRGIFCVCRDILVPSTNGGPLGVRKGAPESSWARKQLQSLLTDSYATAIISFQSLCSLPCPSHF